VAVLESAPGKLVTMLGDCLLSRKEPLSAVITQGTRLSDFSDGYDLFVALSVDASAPPPVSLSCRALLLPGDAPVELLSQIPSKWATSFGLSVKDSITVSSLGSACAVLALQRELVTLEGAVTEQQEIPLPIPSGASAAEVMALYGSLLLLGVPPEGLAV